MNSSSWKRLASLAGVVVLVLCLAGCSEDEGTMYTDEEAPETVASRESGTSLPGDQTAAAEGMSPQTAAMEGAMETPTEEERDAMAAMGHSLPPPPSDRPHLATDVPTLEKEITGVIVTVPKAWKETPKEELSMLRAAQFSIPPAEGTDTGAELVAYNFGPGQGGSAMANIERWLGQVKIEENTKPEIYQKEVNGLTVTEVLAKGTLLPSTMGMAPEEPQPDSALYGIMIEGGPAGNVFIKVTGGAATIESAGPALVTLVDSVKLAGKTE